MGYIDDEEYVYEHDHIKTGDRVGLALIGVTGSISAISTLTLLTYITWYGFFSKKRNQPMAQGIRSFSRSALGAYLYSLLLSDCIQGTAFIINLKWAAYGSMKSSTTCTVQGSILQVGDLGSALWSLAIAYHTFSLLFLLKKPPIWVTRSIFFAGWMLILILPIVGPLLIQDLEKSGPFYAVSGAWCWVGEGYQLERILYVIMWIFLSLFTSIVFYGLIYLRFSGRLVFQDGRLTWNRTHRRHFWNFTVSSPRTPSSRPSTFSQRMPEPTTETNGIGRHLKTISKRLMFYPLVYSTVTIPLTICRFGTMAHWKPPFQLFVLAGVTFSSSGLSNVLLFIVTRHSLLRRTTSTQPAVQVGAQQVTILENIQGVRSTSLHHLDVTDTAGELEESTNESREDVLVAINAKGEGSQGLKEGVPVVAPDESHRHSANQ